MPKYKSGIWDGKIRLVNLKTNKCYTGNKYFIEQFCKDRGYEFIDNTGLEAEEFSELEAKEFVKTLNLPYELRDYQLKAFIDCVRETRGLLLSPTGSGKSLIIYLLMRYYNKKTLIIEGDISNILQLQTELKGYGCPEEDIHYIFSGKNKENLPQFTISTWQSARKMPPAWLNQFDMIIVDEAHGADAPSLIDILEKANTVKHKFGTTGTIKEAACHEYQLRGLFGKIIKHVETHELIEAGVLSDLTIKCIELFYTPEECKAVSKLKYADEIDWIVTNQKRNRFIANLALSLSGNNLILFRYEKHGKLLYEMLKKKAKVPVYYVSGTVDGEDRENIRQAILKSKDSIVLGSIGTYAVGINIPNLNNAINAHPRRGLIKLLQSIGRLLRRTDDKKSCVFYDIADNLQWKKKHNITLNHYIIRLKIYIKQKFKYKTYRVKLKGL